MLELDRIRSWLISLPASNDNFGLIHYDFQLDNVFWDENEQQFAVIDFDDSMYHWLAMDIVRTLVDLFENDGSESRKKIETFLNGYHSVLPTDNTMVSDFPKFLRFDQLYSFSRLLWSLENSEGVEEAPPWYDGLRTKLMNICNDIRQGFLKPW